MSESAAKAIVYQATNVVNGCRYIGFTTQGLLKRRYQHLWDARKNSGYHFHNAIRKYGEENFIFEVLGDFDGDEDLAKMYECEAIAKYRPEYNLTYGGEGGTMHPATRQKIAEANSRRVITDEIRKNIGDAQRGKKRGAETREKLRLAGLGRKHTPETIEKMRAVCGHETTEEARAKMSAARKGRVSPAKGKKWSTESRLNASAARKGKPSSLKGTKLSEAHKQKIAEQIRLNPPSKEALKKPVRCLADGRVFDSAAEADKFYGLPSGSVCRWARGKNRSSRGLLFEYVVKE